MYDFEGKVALVTGGANGIGLSCVKELLHNGVQGVAVVDINTIQGNNAVKILNQEFGTNKTIFIQADVTKAEQFEDAFKETLNKWKTIDIVLNNAGVFNDEQWELEVSVNCCGLLRGTLLGFKYMGTDKSGNGGIIVNMASILGLQPMSGCPIYVASKYFVVGLDLSLGTPYHYNRTGVKVLTMCPGVTKTDLVEDVEKQAITSLASDIGQLLIAETSPFPTQSAENVGKSVITLIKEGNNGSVWVVQNDKPAYEVEIPDRHTF